MFSYVKRVNPRVAPGVYIGGVYVTGEFYIGDSFTINGDTRVWNGEAWVKPEVSYADYQKEIANKPTDSALTVVSDADL